MLGNNGWAAEAPAINHSRPLSIAMLCSRPFDLAVMSACYPLSGKESKLHEGTLMSKEIADHHLKAAEHHEHSARHHRAAAEHHANGDHEKAGHHAHVAQGHQNHAMHHATEASKQHANDHGQHE